MENSSFWRFRKVFKVPSQERRKRGIFSMGLIDETYEEAKKIMHRSITPRGLYASGTKYGYLSIWPRDSMISFLGASLYEDKAIQTCYRNTLITLSRYQSKQGQIPNCVDFKRRLVTFGTIDSSLWYIIGQHTYAKNYRDHGLLKRYKKNIEKALNWVQYQDSGDDKLPEQQPTTDWEDAFPHKYGHTINTQALYYYALRLMGKEKDAREVKFLVNDGGKKPWLSLWNKREGYYYAYAWKDHAGIREEGAWFDSLGNILAIVFGLADREKAKMILRYIQRKNINKPFPVRCLDPPFHRNTREWQPYFDKCISKPHQYLNSGVWPFIGGFYVASLVAMKEHKKAEEELKNLALANMSKGIKWRFSEWLNGENGKPKGSEFQSWSIGMYLFAYQCVKERKVLIA